MRKGKAGATTTDRGLLFFADVKIFSCDEEGSISDLLFCKNYRVDPVEPDCPGGGHIWQPIMDGDMSGMICSSCFLRRRDIARDSFCKTVYGRYSFL